MSRCPICRAEIDDAALAAGRCGKCGAQLRNLPRRTLHGLDPQTDKPSADIDIHEDIDPNVDPDSVHTLELKDEGFASLEGAELIDDASEDRGVATVAFSGEKTIDFPGQPVGDESESLVTAQWAGNVADEAQVDSNCTIKQKETVSGPLVTKSSLVVKSRQVRSGSDVAKPGTLPEDSPDYELLDVIGEGGMGVVYAARQSAIARTVAVKMLKRADADTAEQREKFISEAVVTGELDHPNIVPIYDLGANDAGALFYSMKRVKGTPWNKAIKKNSLDENLNILLRVADAVAFAHANGVVHRDLKPENTMLGDFGEVLVMDWGLARISPEFPNADSVSQSDVMGGTPAYMAPEMATGPVEKITPASDIYLLGAILFEIITGRPPHTGSTVMACLFAAAKNKIVAYEEQGELIEIALTAMAAKTEDRYQTVRDFQAAVKQYQSHSESIVLAESASQSLAAASESNDYDLFSRALYGFEEALSLWEGNRRARDLLCEARLAYARSALGKGDFDLGISLLDPEDAEHGELLAKLETGKQERASRQRRLRALKALVAMLIVAVVGVVSVAYFAVKGQRDKAVAARRVAETQRQRAETEKERAEREKERAESEQQRAEREKLRAEQQRQLAVAAKQAEEYEAYVARIGLASAKIEENAFDRAGELLAECNPELRQWEWGRLAYLCQLSKRTWDVDGHVESVAFSPNGKLFASGDWDGKLRLWNAETGEPVRVVSHGQYVHCVVFDLTGKRLATGSSDRTIRVYDVANGKLLQTLAGHTDAVLSVRFSADGQKLLSSGYDHTARLWDLATSAETQILRGHSWWVWAAEFSPDNRRLVTASQDGKAIVWQWSEDRQRFETLTEFTQHHGPIYAAQFSPDGMTIATAGYGRRVLLWNPDDVQPVDIARRLDDLSDPPAPYRELLGHQGPVRAVAFSPDGKSLASGGQDNVVRVWDLSDDQQQMVFRGHASHVRDCVYSPDGRRLLSAGRDQQIKLWQAADYGESFVLGGGEDQQTDAVLAARFSRDGTQIVTASRDRSARLWDVKTKKLVGQFSEGHDFLASSARFFADGTRLATGAGDGTTRIWDVATGTEIMQLVGTGRTAVLDVSDNGRWIVTAGADQSAIVWDTQTGSRETELQGHEAEVTAASFAPGGKLLATGDDRGRCRIWQRDGDGWIGGPWLVGHSRSITALAYTAGGSQLVSSSGDNSCGQWDVATGRELTERVLSHPDWVSDMDVSDDGALAITSCDDGNLRLWSLADAQLARTIEPAGDVVFTAVDISPDGNHALAACAAEGTVRMWNLDTGEEIVGEDSSRAWLDFKTRGGIVWSARFAPKGKRVLTIGGNDAQLWDIQSRDPLVRFSPHGAVASADVSPDGRLLVTGSWDRSAKIWDIATGKALRKLDGVHQGYVNSVEFSPDGKLVLTGSDDGTARLWDIATGLPVEPVLRGHASRIRQARFSSDGSRALTTANDKTARVWDARNGESLVTLVGHEWAVLCGEFSRDGHRVITGSEDNTAIIWDAETGDQLLKLAGHTDSITSVALSPDGTRALTGSQDSTAKLWDATTGKEILTLVGHAEELTSVSFSPDGRAALTSSRDGITRLWPALDWHGE